MKITQDMVNMLGGNESKYLNNIKTVVHYPIKRLD